MPHYNLGQFLVLLILQFRIILSSDRKTSGKAVYIGRQTRLPAIEREAFLTNYSISFKPIKSFAKHETILIKCKKCVKGEKTRGR